MAARCEEAVSVDPIIRCEESAAFIPQTGRCIRTGLSSNVGLRRNPIHFATSLNRNDLIVCVGRW